MASQIDDLATALKSLQSGTESLSRFRAITQANEAVQQVRTTEENEANKRAQFQQIANQLTVQLAAGGTPDTTIQSVAGALGQPNPKATANQLASEAYQTGNTQLASIAKQQQTFEEDPLNKRLAMQERAAKARLDASMGKQTESDKRYADKAFTGLDKRLDPTGEVRSSFGRGAIAMQQIGKVDAIINSTKDFNKLSKPEVVEVASGIAQMLKNGIATEGELHQILPDTVGMKAAQIQTYITNNPAAMNTGGFVEIYQKFLNRERAEMTFQQQQTVLSRATGNLRLAKLDPEQFKATVAQKAGVNPEDIVIDEKNKTVNTKEGMQREDRANRIEKGLKEAYTGIKSQDPASRAKAQNLFKALGIDPNKLPAASGIPATRAKILRGII